MIVTDKEFIDTWYELKSPDKIAKKLGISLRSVYKRRRYLEGKHKIELSSESDRFKHLSTSHIHRVRHNCGIRNGRVLVFSDAHFWPGIQTTAYRGLLLLIKELKPMAVICNGDAFDGSSISRFPRIGWTHQPTVKDELIAAQDSLGEIAKTAKKAVPHVQLAWPLGNHDARLENKLAAVAPQYEGVPGFTLKDHFPDWTPCWSCWPTDKVVIKHRYKGGIHATHQNTQSAGLSMVTGHLHSLKVTPFSDYNGTRFGVDTGTLADPGGPQFVDYMEDNPANWRSGFIVLTFKDGNLLWPEIVSKFDEGVIDFRGELINV